MKYQNGRYGVRAVLNSPWSNRLLEDLVQHRAAELELNMAKGWYGRDISFLALLPDLLAFDILDLRIDDIAPIHHLGRLRALGITTYCRTPIDFSKFPDLEDCGLEWRPKATSLFERRSLRRLFVNRYKGKDSSPFGQLVNLEELGLLNSSLRSLEGLRSLKRLKRLRLGNLRSIDSLRGLEGLTQLEELDINTCRGFHRLDELRDLRSLRTLHLSNCGTVVSLEPIAGLHALETVTLIESTNIADGDISPLRKLPKLSNVAFMNRRHYSHRAEDFGAAFVR